ncbi:anthranilate synthase component II [Lentibacillus sediminis]|uniref:anthranilate synthase component II n=1 Tax=Lentibacillus sediminis TaxID=1940529 RepID=UPI000C1C6F8A|nr:aminodeoxychorismate/anthranilate synthase component II [Lentibacillus sediminis]
MILLIDNYDSFTYNIYQYAAALNEEIDVVRNDRITLEEIEAFGPDAIILSPGPGLPAQAGICIELVKTFYEKIPLLGICLGQQAIAEALGGRLIPAKVLKHGKTSLITHNGTGLFSYLPQPLEVMRYHSYVVDPQSLPTQLENAATSLEDNELMAIQHTRLPVYGVQFHPESIGTATGMHILENFIQSIKKRKEQGYETIS